VENSLKISWTSEDNKQESTDRLQQKKSNA
jgi:ribosomal protein L33